MQKILLALFLLSTASLSAQPDEYLTGLVDFLSVQFTLPDATYPYYDNEDDYRRRSGAYNLARTSEPVTGQEFSELINLRVSRSFPFAYEAGWNVVNQEPIQQGDKVLYVIYLRAKPNATNDATARANLFIERSTDFRKEFEIPIDLDETWRRYFIRIDAQSTYPKENLVFGLHVGYRAQNVQIGGLAVINYGQDVPLELLPENLNVSEYGGFEADAPWRAEAAQRIENIRKADLNLTVLDVDGSPLSNADVAVNMQNHEFKFGTAVAGSRFPGGQRYSQTFVRNLFDLDGKGHGFNAIVFENDFKWPGWEQQWVTTNSQMRRTVSYLADRNIHMRGHVLLWPGWDNMPFRMENNAGDPDYLKAQIENHLVKMLETENFDVPVTDWDVINEINTNRSLEGALKGTPGYETGREIYAEVFKRARELALEAELVLNDYVTISAKNEIGSLIYDQYQSFVQEIVDADAPITGIGFQAHIGGSPNSIYEVEDIYDDFYNRFQLDQKITEFDMRTPTDTSLAKAYLRDYLTMTFSHPSMDAFMFWNWWDVDTWQNRGANLYYANWEKRPTHKVFTDLVFNDWWTDETVTTNGSGQADLRGFKGEYTITLMCGDQEVTTRMNLTEDSDMTLDCAQLLTSTERPQLPTGSVSIFPNPGRGAITLSNNLPLQLEATLYDVSGRQIWEGTLRHGATTLDIYLNAGSYQLRFTDGVRTGTEQVIRW
ncbi:endo-1,4-beta-xylanase [Lewinella sp. 4G2]|uniref:endo-1,4-beta-xylanase n=1 Tax=Lewinella sp. 4G2 TaxID=1803372 RepID=UPI0007B4EF94|nr:endo-1,4-beta-xylanase [Lewinella sp. 4G2]OAV44810.1 hypothetical protein A3850_010055 [Lewinella sp. 4G2]